MDNSLTTQKSPTTQKSNSALVLTEQLNSLSTIAPEAVQKWKDLIAQDGAHYFDVETAVQVLRDHSAALEPRYAMALDFKRITERRTPSLVAIARYGDEVVALELLSSMISRTAKFFNVGGAMTAEQVDETACLVFDLYRTLTIDDCALCLKRAKAGQYGKVFDRLDGAVVLQWFATYLAERSEAMEQASIKAHYDRKEAERTAVWDKAAIAKLGELLVAAQEREKKRKEEEKEAQQLSRAERWRMAQEKAQEQVGKWIGAEKAYWGKVFQENAPKENE